MECDKKEDMEMEMLLQEISCGHCQGYCNGSSSSSGSFSPSGDDTSVATLSSPDSSQRFSSPDGVTLRSMLGSMWVSDEPEPDFERDPFEYSVFEAGDLEKTEFKNEFGMREYSAFPLEINSTVPWVNGHQFDASIQGTNILPFSPSVFDDANFSPCNADPFEQFSKENSDVPVSVSYYWKHTDAVKCKSIDMKSYHLNSEKLHGFRNRKLNESLIGVKGYVYLFAKDHNGCRFLQKKLAEGKEFIDLIFNGILSHTTELSINPFGNYLMQKMIQLCNEEQRKLIVVSLTRDPSELVRVSLNIHG
jgi:Pumilio-family RNA binding repeat